MSDEMIDCPACGGTGRFPRPTPGFVRAFNAAAIAAGHEPADDLIRSERKRLVDFVRAVLLFHRGGPWGEAEYGKFCRLLGGEVPATTRGLCDAGRDILRKIGEDV